MNAASPWQSTLPGIGLADCSAVRCPRLCKQPDLLRSLENIPVIESPLLAEHSRRTNAPYGSVAAFDARIRRLFDAPDELAFGDETANQARQRFQRGILSLLEIADPTENIVVLTHGTVAVLFAAQYNTIDSYDLWRKLKMPSLIEMESHDFRICQVIEDAGID